MYLALFWAIKHIYLKRIANVSFCPQCIAFGRRSLQERRAEEIERKKQAQIYASAKLLLEKNNINIETSRSKPSISTQNNPVKKQKQLKEESSDEEVYVVQSKKKKNVKKRIILESSDDDESSDDEQVQINREPAYRDTSIFFV